MPIVSGGGGGSVAVITNEVVADNVGATIGNGAVAPLPWTSHAAGDVLLDRTTDTAPTVIDAGTYAVKVRTRPTTALTVGGVFYMSLEFDPTGDDITTDGLSFPATAGSGFPIVTLTNTWYLHAGWVIQVNVENDDGAAARNFKLSDTLIQRLS